MNITMFCSQDQPQHGRLLRSFRSLKSLKAESQRQQRHERLPSQSSSIARSSIESQASRPSTSRTDNSLDWDPLRLHPPMNTARSPFGVHDHDVTPTQRRTLRESRSTYNLRPGPDRAAQTSSLEIYDGFDFGFAQKPQQMLYEEQTAISSWPSPTPSSSSEFEGRTPRPHPETMDAPDYFMKRGNWKRRGIVFVPDEPVAVEDECFDLDL